jgi:hypothetical protein
MSLQQAADSEKGYLEVNDADVEKQNHDQN